MYAPFLPMLMFDLASGEAYSVSYPKSRGVDPSAVAISPDVSTPSFSMHGPVSQAGNK
jgi:hypothetical protein